jgi:hypothetical protein
MKFFQRLSFLLTFLFLGQAALAQLLPPTSIPPEVLPPYECGIDQVSTSEPKSAPCTPDSDTWLDYYRNPGYWIPDTSTPEKTIKVNWIVCQDSAGNGWQDIPEFHDRVQMFFDSINEDFGNIPLKGYELTCDPNVEHLIDSKIRFELGQIYFFQNTDWHYLPGSSLETPILDHLFDLDPSARGALNHVFTNGPYFAFGHYRQSVSGESIIRTTSLTTDSLGNVISKLMFNDWWMPMEWTGHFAHEYAHALGLHHNYQAEYKNINHFDFLDDVFGTCAEPLLTDQSSICYNGCNPPADEICYFNSCFYAQYSDPTPIMSGGMVGNLYISPKSIGRFHRALSLYDETFRLNNRKVNRYVKEKYPYEVDYPITQDETWDFAIKMYQNIVVKTGNALTITCEVKMPIDGKIIVEPGASLIIDGGRITSAHDEMWQGIELQGNTNLEQTTANQGVLVTKNNAVIENAREAISFIEPGNWDSRGGIAWCKDTQFINNKRSAQFLKYPSTDSLETYGNIPDYKSYFIKCDFIFNDENLLTSNEPAPKAQVTLWGVKGVKFLGCTFENTNNVNQSEDRSKGIFSIDASYRINSYCDVTVVVGDTCPAANTTLSSFKGYNYAVHPEGATGNYGPDIRRTDFDQNMVGIYLDGANNSQIMGNEFVVGSHPYPTIDPLDDDATLNTGILTEGLTGFIIEDNTFNGDNSITDFTHGVTVQEGGGALVEVYNNEMNNLGSGAIGAGDNDDNIGNGAYGLRFLCNKNTGNSTDFEVRTIEGGELFGYIDANQAGTEFTSQAAGNTFSAGDAISSNYVHMYYKSNKSYSYQYNNTDPAEIPDENNEVFITPPGDIYEQLTTIAHTCPTTETDGGIVKQEYTGIKSEFYNLLYTYHQFIDQGNTEAALNDVALSWSTDAWTLRDQLMARSPNNSDTVLIAAANKNLLPHGMLLEVLVSNPDALQDGTVINHVKCCIANPMPQYMIDILYASRNLQTARTIIERNLSNLRHRMASRHRVVLQDMLTDTVATHPDTLVDLLDDLRHKEGRYMLITEYLNRGDYAAARTEMDSLQSQIQLGGKGTVEVNKMRQFTNFLENIDAQGKNFAQLDSVEIDFLMNLANTKNSGTAGARAENILCFFYDMCSPPPSSPKSNETAPRKPKPTYEELVQEQNKVSLSPNPADQFIQLKYELLYSKKHTEMHVYDQLGRRVTSYTIGATTQGVEILDTRKLTQGVYIVEIVQNGKQVLSNKFIVQH